MVLYNLGVRAYGLAIRIAALRGAKPLEWVRGRKKWRGQLRTIMSGLPQPRIWVHCASYGEFEQGRPVIEALRRKFPGHRIVLTFFSPSGYVPFSQWEGADAIVYLPLDTPRNAADFLELVRPSGAVFIKYEFWLNYLREMRRRNIPGYLVSAVFKPHHPFFKWYGGIFRASLKAFRVMFIQDPRSGELLERIGMRHYKISGDTRFDRVLEIRNQTISFAWLDAFKGGNKLIVAGSTWPGDEELVLAALAAMPQDVKLLLVPHDVTPRDVENTVERVEESGMSFRLYSGEEIRDTRVLVLDAVGLLSRVYKYADVAYIGGGFDGGLHNSLEAAVFGVPVTFYGNDYTRFNEAVELLAMGAAVNVKNAEELSAAWRRLLEKGEFRSALETYFSEKAGSAERVVGDMAF